MKRLLGWALPALLFATACQPKEAGSSSGSTAKDSTASPADAPAAAANTPSQAPFTLSAKEGPTDEATGVPSFDISLSHPNWGGPNYLVTEPSFSEIPAADFGSKKIPAGAAFAFSTWYAGGGYDYYGIWRDGMLDVFRRGEDEGLAPHSGAFMPFKQYGMDAESPAPDHFICYKPDAGKAANLVICFDSEGYALDARYEGHKGWIRLVHDADLTEKGSTNLTTRYKEMDGDKQTGTYVLTHSGNWDYVTYTGNNGKETKFTIDHERSVEGDGYRRSPCF